MEGKTWNEVRKSYVTSIGFNIKHSWIYGLRVEQADGKSFVHGRSDGTWFHLPMKDKIQTIKLYGVPGELGRAMIIEDAKGEITEFGRKTDYVRCQWSEFEINDNEKIVGVFGTFDYYGLAEWGLTLTTA